MSNKLVVLVITLCGTSLILFGRRSTHDLSRAAIRRTVVAQPVDHPVVTRLVSCGGRGATVDGDDAKGIVTTPGTDCTVVFEKENDTRSCVIDGGTIVRLTKTDLIVTKISDNKFTYTCE